MRAIALVLLIPYICSACFAYVPAAGTPHATGESVRVFLSRPQAVELEEVTAGNITVVEGEVAAADDGALVVSAWNLISGSGAEFPAQGQSVRISAGDVERVERKEISWLRTGSILALGILAGVLFNAAEGGISGDRGSPPPATGK